MSMDNTFRFDVKFVVPVESAIRIRATRASHSKYAMYEIYMVTGCDKMSL
jgi:hypothetical protein